MPNRLKPFNYMDFTGGVNLRPETFQLLDNELPVLLNLEPDPRGGINCRKSWKASGEAIVGTNWDPHSAFIMRQSDGEQFIYVATYNALYGRIAEGSTWTNIIQPVAASPHLVDYASWGDMVKISRGRTLQGCEVNGLTNTVLTASGGANWQDDYTNPGATKNMPQAEHNGQHAGYLFVGNTQEAGVNYPNRLRWSHVNNAYAWASDDYHDIEEGGSSITAIIPFSDRLLVFKPDSVWAVFGYDADSWEITNISRTIGCPNAQLVCRSETAVFFLSWPNGIFAYSEKGVDEISVQIRAAFTSNLMDPLALDKAFLGWTDRKLWCSLPYSGRSPVPDVPETVFVFDPVLSAWTMHRGHANCVPGPYIERSEMDTYESEVAVLQSKPYAVALDAEFGTAVDECVPGDPQPFDTMLRTRWIDAGAPTWRKSWRRPDFLLRALTVDSTLNVQVFHNYDPTNAQRSFTVSYTPDVVRPIYGQFQWGDGTIYGGTEQSSSVERGGTMGRAGAVQLLMTGFPAVQWGLNGIIFKFILRRFR